jgi:hypothetical protein
LSEWPGSRYRYAIGLSHFEELLIEISFKIKKIKTAVTNTNTNDTRAFESSNCSLLLEYKYNLYKPRLTTPPTNAEITLLLLKLLDIRIA